MGNKEIDPRIERVQRSMYKKYERHTFGAERASHQKKWKILVGEETALSRLFKAAKKGIHHPSARRDISFYQNPETAFRTNYSSNPSMRRGRDLTDGGPPTHRTKPDASVRTISDRRGLDFYKNVFGDDPASEYADGDRTFGPDIEYLE